MGTNVTEVLSLSPVNAAETMPISIVRARIVLAAVTIYFDLVELILIGQIINVNSSALNLSIVFHFYISAKISERAINIKSSVESNNIYQLVFDANNIKICKFRQRRIS